MDQLNYNRLHNEIQARFLCVLWLPDFRILKDFGSLACTEHISWVMDAIFPIVFVSSVDKMYYNRVFSVFLASSWIFVSVDGVSAG
jgi:hypothetical protein